MEFITVSEKPIVKVAIEKVGGLRYCQERQFDSDSGYDGNIRQRVQAMTASAIGVIIGKDGELLVQNFPPFDPRNRLRVTVELLGPEVVKDVAKAETPAVVPTTMQAEASPATEAAPTPAKKRRTRKKKAEAPKPE